MSLRHAMTLLASVLGYAGLSVLLVLRCMQTGEVALAVGFVAAMAPILVVCAELWSRDHNWSGRLFDKPQFWIFPVTHHRRALNRQYRLYTEMNRLSGAARECRALAASYRKRGERQGGYDAKLLEAQADHNERLAKIKKEDAERITRELEDRKMLELTK